MSVESAVKFLEDIYTNEEKQQELVGSKSANEVISYATTNGYDFTIEELQEGQEQFQDTHDVELSEEELEDAAGGGANIIACYVKAASE